MKQRNDNRTYGCAEERVIMDRRVKPSDDASIRGAMERATQ
jgi:hypothetical protein